MYELYDQTTVMFFFRNKQMMCDFGTGNNNKINWCLDNTKEMIDILEVIYKGATKGRGLVNSPKGESEWEGGTATAAATITATLTVAATAFAAVTAAQMLSLSSQFPFHYSS